MSDITIIPHVVINPTNIVSYSEIIFDKPRKRQKVEFIDVNRPIEEQKSFLNSTRKAEGKVSEQAKRKIGKAIEYLVTIASEKKVHEKLSNKTVIFKLAFLTLTLPSKQIHPDTEIINTCLNSFFNECRKVYNVRNYVWRAEKQKNGNIHFHIITDKFIPYYEARNRWNRIVNKLGYVDRFQAIHGSKQPNSTDIHSTRKIKNLKTYLVKYMAKDHNPEPNEQTTNESTTQQTGRIWGCNHELSQTRGLNLIVDSEIDSELRRVLTKPEVRKYEGSYFTVYYLDYHLLRKYGSDILFQYFSDYLFTQLNFSEQLKTTG
jgi:hypothetical protein